MIQVYARELSRMTTRIWEKVEAAMAWRGERRRSFQSEKQNRQGEQLYECWKLFDILIYFI